MDYLKSANNSVFSIAAVIITLLVALQALLFIRFSFKEGLKLGLTRARMMKALRTGFVTSIVPSIPAVVALIAMIPVLGLPIPWIRQTIMGSTPYELTAAGIGAKAMGVAGLGGEGYTASVFASSVWIMTMGSIWAVLIVVFFGVFSIFIADPIVSGGLPLVTLAAGAVLLTILALLIVKLKISWFKEFALTISMVGAMSCTAVFANLETPLYPGREPGNVPAVCLTAPALNTTPAMFERFTDKGRGIIFFATANNHSLDQGEEGIISTLDYLDKQGYRHVGTSRTPEEQCHVPVIEKNGVRIAFLSYTYSLNAFDPVPGKEYMTNVIRLNKPDTDLGLLKEHVQSAREQQADIIVALLHWSVEFETYPLENIIRMGHRVIECGVDIILGGHAHVAQPMEVYPCSDPDTGAQRKGFIIYSLGELLSYNAFSRNSRLTWVIRLVIAKGVLHGKATTVLTGVKVLPVYTLIRKTGKKTYDYRLLDFWKTLADIRAGRNSCGFSRTEIRELERLETLLYRCLLPGNYRHLLE